MENKKSTKAKTEKAAESTVNGVTSEQFLTKLNELLETAKKKKNIRLCPQTGCTSAGMST